MLKQELLRHKIAYPILILGLLAFTIGFLAVWPDRALQRYLIIGVSTFYFLWGVITHVKAEHISRGIILEYAGVATLASVLLLLITW